MNCNCSLTNAILAILVVVFTYWKSMYSEWVVYIAAVLLLIHSLVHKHTNTASSRRR